MGTKTQNPNLNPFAGTSIKNLEYIQNKALVIAPYEITKSTGLIDPDIMLDTPGYITLYFYKAGANAPQAEPGPEQFKSIKSVFDLSSIGLTPDLTNSAFLGSQKIPVIFKYDKTTCIRTIEKDPTFGLDASIPDLTLESSWDLDVSGNGGNDYFVVCNVQDITKTYTDVGGSKSTNQTLSNGSGDFLFMIPSSECQEIITTFDILDTNNKVINIKPMASGTGLTLDKNSDIDFGYVADFFGDGTNTATFPLDVSARNLCSSIGGVPFDIATISNDSSKYATSALFNGTSSRIYVNSPIIIPSNMKFSINVWLKGSSLTNTTTTVASILTYSNLSFFQIGTYSSNLYVTFKNSAGTDTTINYPVSNFNATTWYNICVTFNGVNNNFYLYVNGVQVGTVAAPSSIYVPRTGNLCIGYANPTTPYQFFNGSMDSLRIFNRPLTKDEVVAIYKNVPTKYKVVQQKNPETLMVANDSSTEIDFFGDGSNVANYKLKSNANDTAGKYNGVVTDTISWNAAGYLQSSTGYINLGNPHGNSDVVTISAWICWNGVDNKMPFGSSNNNIWFMGGNMGLNTSNSDIYGISSAGFSGVWKHIIVEFHTGEYGKLWVDGVFQVLTQKTGAINTNKNNIITAGQSITIFSNGTYANFGAIQDVKIFNRQLSNAEAYALYKGTPLKLIRSSDFFRDGQTIATYTFNESCNDVGNVYNGTGTSITYVPGRFGKCASFNGTSSVVDIGWYPASNTTPFAFSGWVKLNPGQTGGYIASFRKNTDIVVFCTQTYIQISSYNGTAYYIQTPNMDLSNWTHIIGQFTGSGIQLFVNGEYIGNQQIIPQSYTASTKFGADWDNNPYFTGQLDTIRIFNRTLSLRDVQELYNEQPSYEEQLTLVEATGKTLTSVGNPLLRYNSEKGPGIFVNGTDNFTLASSSNLDFTQDSTIEFWFKPNAAPASGDANAMGLMGTTGTWGNGEFGLNFGTQNWDLTKTNRLLLWIYASGTLTPTVYSSFALVIGQWYHVALVQTGTVIKLYINGVLDSTSTNGKKFTTVIPHGFSFFGGLNGGIKDFHIMNGTAKYSANFTPPLTIEKTPTTTLLLQVQKPVYNTEAWVQTQLVTTEIQDANPTITEQTGKALTNTGVTIDKINGISKFPNGNLSFNGSSYLTVDATNILNFGTNDFTIEFWYYTNSSVNYNVIMGIDESDTLYPFVLEVSSIRGFRFYNYYTNLNYQMNPNTAQWIHYAITRTNGSLLSLYVDGVVVSQLNIELTTTYNFTNMYIGKQGTYYANGILNDFRISNISRYATNFTPPTTSLVKDTNTVFLLQVANPNQSLTLKSPKVKDFFGDKSMVSAYLFENNANDETGFYNGTATGMTYTNGKFGMAANFNGAGYIDTGYKLNSNQTDYSFSLWFKTNTTDQINIIGDQTGASVTTGRFSLFIYSSKLYIYLGRLDGNTTVDMSNYLDNNYHHLVISVSNMSISVFVDGLEKVSNIVPGVTLTQSPSNFRIGQLGADTGNRFKGQIENVRIFNKSLTQAEVTLLANETTTDTYQVTLEQESEILYTDPDFFGDKSNIANYLLNGNTFDIANRFNGVGTGITYEAGKFQQAAVSSSTSQIDCGIPQKLGMTVTISAWIKWNGTDSTIPFGFNKYGLIFYSGNMGFNTGNGDVWGISSTGFNGVWRHITVEFYTGNYGRIFVDGVLQTSTQRASTIDATQALVAGKNLYIFGWSFDTAHRNFGSISNVRVFNTRLNNDQVMDLYKESKKVTYKVVNLPATLSNNFIIDTNSKPIRRINYKTWTGSDASKRGFKLYPVMKISDHIGQEDTFSPKYYLGAKYQRNLSEILVPAVKSKRTISNLKDMYLVDDLCIQTLKKINTLLETTQLIKFTERLYSLATPIREKLNADLILEYLSTPVLGTMDSDITAILKTSLIEDYGFTQAEITNLNDNLNTFTSRARISTSGLNGSIPPVVQGTGNDQIKINLPKTFIDGNRSKTEKKNLLVFGTDAGFDKYSLSGYAAPYSNVTKRGALTSTQPLVYNDLVAGCPVLSKENSTKGSILIDEYTKLLIYNGLDNKVSSIPVDPINMSLTNTVTKNFANSIDFTGVSKTIAMLNTNFIFDANDFSIETMVYLKTMPTSNTTSYSGGVWNGLGLIFGSNLSTLDTYFAIGSTNIVCQINGTQVLSPSAHGMTTNTWYKINISRTGGRLLEFRINDVSIGTVAITATSLTFKNSTLYIGCYYINNINYMKLNGYMDYIKVTNGITIDNQYTNLNTFKDILTNYKQQIPFTYIPLSTDSSEQSTKPVFENLTDITGFDHSEIVIDLPSVL